MGKNNARHTRCRAESAAAARGASSREGYQASGTLEVSPPPAWHSAPPRCRLRNTVAFSSFSCLRPTKHFRVGRYMANRRSINSTTLPKWVYYKAEARRFQLGFRAISTCTAPPGGLKSSKPTLPQLRWPRMLVMYIRSRRASDTAGQSLTLIPSMSAHSVPVYPIALADSPHPPPLAWSLVPCSSTRIFDQGVPVSTGKQPAHNIKTGGGRSANREKPVCKTIIVLRPIVINGA